ncbi:hypothetical protein SDRG_14847 [Saprolegnia diclina VS20]|uniref:Uncharacterized protein n=1 Tax=Saprolegnia diclina (strain VS20) TaxID=1156394 RepID=T0RCK7_SAPDV|nr:hypothetical protein SDRG_14847 [Saprolegnia diclina VS20]EQC27322.1 hypothetical protein SDRG_14847 [Saprolegnia diclina VS20]|eukprot:XP_008619226.1 hypothetical protein SDRG_14847 [Saprolegnia diclina VS20]
MWGTEVLAQDVLARVHALHPTHRGFLLLHEPMAPSHPMDHVLTSVDELSSVLDDAGPLVLVVVHSHGLDLPRLVQLIALHQIAFVWIDTVSNAPLDFPAPPTTTAYLRLTHTYVYASFACSPSVHHWLFRPLEDPVNVYGSLVAQDLVRHGRGLVSVPLQLALVVLRLLHYSPSILLQNLPLLEKKILNLNTARLRQNVRKELLRVYKWPHVPDAIATFLQNESLFGANDAAPLQPSLLFGDAPASTDGLTTVAASPVWSAQKDFYKAHGMGAWSSNIVPYGVSSSMFIAEAYARVVLQFFLDCHGKGKLDATSPINAYVIEGGSGCCKFGLAFARHLLGLLAGLELHTVIRPCIILTDLSVDVLDSRIAHVDFQSLVAAFPGQLEFAVLDVEDIIARRGPLFLRVANAPLQLAPTTPIFFIGNYFLDSLPTDVFLVEPSGLSPVLTDEAGDSFAPSPLPLPDPSTHYESAALNATLLSVPRGLRVSLLLFPVQAYRFLSAILPPTAPFGLLFGDATVHSSDTFHHVPELSPHADCFCLPVDFSLLEAFLSQSFPKLTFQSTLQVFADTFQVCYATHFPDDAANLSSPLVFEAELQAFGANDCDLIMGTIQDTPDAFTALEPQMALLALSKWDYDCFAVFMWPMVRQVPDQPALRASVAEVGLKCFENAYLLKDAGVFNLHLNMARWLYAIQAYEDAAVLLKELVQSQDIRVLYLLGLVCFHLNAVDKAHVLFRACLDMGARAKYQKRIAVCDHILRA